MFFCSSSHRINHTMELQMKVFFNFFFTSAALTTPSTGLRLIIVSVDFDYLPSQVQIILTLVLLSLSVLSLSLRGQRSLSAAVTHSGRRCRGKKRGSRCIVPCGCRSLRRSTRVPRWMWSCQGSWE